MNTNVEALKNLYVQLGGNAEDVQDCSTIVEVLNVLSGKYEGKTDASKNPDAIDNIAEVAENIGGSGFEASFDIIPEQTIMVTGTYKNIGNTPFQAFQEQDLIGQYADVVFDGTTYYKVPISYLNQQGLAIGEYDNNYQPIFDNYPFAITARQSGTGTIYTKDKGQHSIEANVTYKTEPKGTVQISENGTHDVSIYANAEVLVAGNALIAVSVTNQTGKNLTLTHYNASGIVKADSISSPITRTIYAPVNEWNILKLPFLAMSTNGSDKLSSILAAVTFPEGKTGKAIIGINNEGTNTLATLGLDVSGQFEATDTISVILTATA